MINQHHDKLFKAIFSGERRLVDLLQGTLPSEILVNAKLESLRLDPTEYVDQELASSFSDLCCNMDYGDHEIKISILLEHKSYPEKHIHFQLLRYMLNIWGHQIDNGKDLTPVVCLVFYHGGSKWSPAEMEIIIPEELKSFVPTFRFVLYDTSKYEEKEIFEIFCSPSVRVGVCFLKRNRKLVEVIENNPDIAGMFFREMEKMKIIEPEILELLVVYLLISSDEKPEKIFQIIEKESIEFPEIYNPHIRKYVKEQVEEQVKEGLEQRMFETARKMIARGYSDQQIAEITDLGLKRIKALRKESQG